MELTFADLSTPETPVLPAPYKLVKTKKYILYRADGSYSHDGKLRIYMDPRGDITFAIGVPEYIATLQTDKSYHIEHDRKAGFAAVSGSTADAAVKLFDSVQREYADTRRMLDAVEVICLDFSGIAPKYAESGYPIEQEWHYKPSNQRYGGSAGKTLELSLNFSRGWKAQRDFYVKDVKGNLVKSHYSGVTIPFTEETWAQLVSIRGTLVKAIVMLGGVFGGNASAIPELLASMAKTPLLAAPQAVEKDGVTHPPVVKRVRRTRP